MSRTVSAEFETVDLAELAARNIRYKFDGITKIKIRYYAPEDDDSFFIAPVSGDYGIFGSNSMSTYHAAAVSHGKDRETEQKQTGTLIVEARTEDIKRISSYLRSLGGISVKISNDR